MNETKIDRIRQVFYFLFMIWVGYCVYNFSQSGRYQKEKGSHIIIDTQTGKLFKYDRIDEKLEPI
ncbi:hypothetical protein ABMY20_07255 [Tenacibaculum sp. SSH1-16]|uniref:hypothetical protein n=1 Tax=Tenacibaculum sp. SSH1-16 TaxID=3136667 RepID=UPI0032C40601